MLEFVFLAENEKFTPEIIQRAEIHIKNMPLSVKNHSEASKIGNEIYFQGLLSSVQPFFFQ